MQKGKYPNTFYRVSIKALITNEQGHVLVVKENGDIWDLPGGGLDHGESPEDCLRREIKEELGIAGLEIGEPINTKTFYLDHKEAWLIWITYRAELSSSKFIFGDGVTDAKYIDPQELANSAEMFESATSEISKYIH